MSESVRTSHDGPVTTITIDRPKALNALDPAVLDGLEAALVDALAREARAVVVTGAGEKAFVAGADIGELADLDAVSAEEHARRGQRVVGVLARMPKPTIAAVNGYALGGGTELALACDIRLASENAVFGLPEVTLGVIPGFGGTQRLARLVGLGPALDLVVTGRRIKAAEALRLGLVSEVVPAAELAARAAAYAAMVAKNAPVAVSLAKRAVLRGADASLSSGIQLEVAHFAACFSTQDQKEGMRAFVEKRAPAFTGR